MTEDNHQIMQAELKKYISDLIFRSFSTDEKLVSDRIIDSINIVELVIFIESQFYVKISTLDMNADHFDNVESMIKLIQTKSSAKGV